MKKIPFREIALGAGIALSGAACNEMPENSKKVSTIDGTRQHTSILDELPDFLSDVKEPAIYDNPEYYVFHENGEFGPQEQLSRTLALPTGGSIFIDVGLDFYEVEQGDTLASIRKKLAQMPGYAYLVNQTGRMNGFNIHAGDIEPSMKLPIPVESNSRRISDEQFLRFAYEALYEIVDDPEYGLAVQHLRQHYSDEYIVAALLAIAKQESGGNPIGQFELHRYEPRHHAFSYSIFHVLMQGPGLSARKELGLTLGQTYHPKNAIKLFFGYVLEKFLEGKSKNHLDVQQKAAQGLVEIFELNDNFACFYNGKRWKQMNPDYLNNVQNYYQEAEHLFRSNGTQFAVKSRKPSTP